MKSNPCEIVSVSLAKEKEDLMISFSARNTVDFTVSDFHIPLSNAKRMVQDVTEILNSAYFQPEMDPDESSGALKKMIERKKNL
jgi:hypothetical protein